MHICVTVKLVFFLTNQIAFNIYFQVDERQLMYKLAASLFYKLLLVFFEIEGKHLKFTIQYMYTKPITPISRNCQRRFPACNVLNRNIDG